MPGRRQGPPDCAADAPQQAAEQTWQLRFRRGGIVRGTLTASAPAPRFVVRAAIALVALAASVAILCAQSETLVQASSGTYSLKQVVTQSGTANNWIRYRPAVPGGVTIHGGEMLVSSQSVILDGFTIDTRLDLQLPLVVTHPAR